MYDLGRREAVEGRAACGGIRADILGIYQVAHLQVGKLLGKADGIQGIARRAEHRADLKGTFLETPQRILSVVEDLAAEGVIHAVIQVVTELAAADCFANDLRDGGSGGGVAAHR